MKSAHTPRRPVNLTIAQSVIDDAKALGINASRAAEEGLRAAVREEKKRRFYEENKEAIEAHNRAIEENGLIITPIWMRPDWDWSKQ